LVGAENTPDVVTLAPREPQPQLVGSSAHVTIWLTPVEPVTVAISWTVLAGVAPEATEAGFAVTPLTVGAAVIVMVPSTFFVGSATEVAVTLHVPPMEVLALVGEENSPVVDIFAPRKLHPSGSGFSAHV